MKAIIVDGGKASRLGYMSPKGLIRVSGRPLIGYLWARLAELGVDETTLIIGEDSVEAYENSEFGRASRIVMDSAMAGPLSAIDGIGSEFVNEDVIITTGDAFFGSLESLRGCAPGSCLALVDIPRNNCTQVRLCGRGVGYVGSGFIDGSMSYASAIRVNRCFTFWGSAKERAAASGKMIVDALMGDALIDVELRMVNGFWRNVNEPRDLEAVRSYLDEGSVSVR